MYESMSQIGRDCELFCRVKAKGLLSPRNSLPQRGGPFIPGSLPCPVRTGPDSYYTSCKLLRKVLEHAEEAPESLSHPKSIQRVQGSLRILIPEKYKYTHTFASNFQSSGP